MTAPVTPSRTVPPHHSLATTPSTPPQIAHRGNDINETHPHHHIPLKQLSPQPLFPCTALTAANPHRLKESNQTTLRHSHFPQPNLNTAPSQPFPQTVPKQQNIQDSRKISMQDPVSLLTDFVAKLGGGNSDLMRRRPKAKSAPPFYLHFSP